MSRVRCVACVVGLLLLAGVGHAHDPQAAFALKGGWVECTVERDGRPVANAALSIQDAHGNKFADGETDDTGLAQFPLPAGDSFTVEIKTGKDASDPIRLTRMGSQIAPARVLLSYGLRPCCRVLVKRSAAWRSSEGGASPGKRLLIWVLSAAAICAVLGVVVFFGRRGTPSAVR